MADLLFLRPFPETIYNQLRAWVIKDIADLITEYARPDFSQITARFYHKKFLQAQAPSLDRNFIHQLKYDYPLENNPSPREAFKLVIYRLLATQMFIPEKQMIQLVTEWSENTEMLRQAQMLYRQVRKERSLTRREVFYQWIVPKGKYFHTIIYPFIPATHGIYGTSIHPGHRTLHFQGRGGKVEFYQLVTDGLLQLPLSPCSPEEIRAFVPTTIIYFSPN